MKSQLNTYVSRIAALSALFDETMIRAYLFAVLLCTASAVSISQPVSWSAVNARVETNQHNVLYTEATGFLVWVDQGDAGNVWQSHDAKDFRPLFDPIDYQRVRYHPRVAASKNGTILIAGTNFASGGQTSVCIHRDGTATWLPDSLVNRIDSRSIRNSPRIRWLGDGVFVVEQLITMDGGSTWHVVDDPGSSLEGYTYAPDSGILARTEDGQWFSCRPPAAWQAFDPGISVAELYAARSGRMVAIRSSFGIRSEVFYRENVGSDWIEVESFVNANGDTISTRSPLGLGPTAAFGVDHISVVLDSGGVIIVDSSGLRTIALDGSAMTRRVSNNRFSAFAQESHVIAEYGDSLYLVDVRNGQIHSNQIIATLDNSQFAVSDTLLFAYSYSESGLGWSTGHDLSGWRASMRLHDSEGGLLFPHLVWSLVPSREGLVWHSQSGAISTLNDSATILRPSRSRTLSYGPLNAQLEFAVGRRRIVGTNGGYVVLGTNPRLTIGELVTRLPFDTVSTVWRQPGASWLAAYRSIFRSREDDAEVDTLLWRAAADTVATVSAVVSYGDTIIAALRGYSRVYDGSSVYTSRGGFLASYDGGDTWRDLGSPVQGQCVEFLFRTSSGDLLAWIRDVEIVGDTVPNSLVGEFEGSANLMRSTDMGATWSTVWSHERHMQEATASTWRITSTPTALYACHSDNGLLVSTDDGTTWTDVDVDVYHAANLADVATIGHQLYLGFDDGVLRVPLTTRISEPTPHFFDAFGVTCSPNPFSESVRISALNYDRLRGGVVTCRVVNISGEVVADVSPEIARDSLVLKGSVTDLSTRSWPPGVYFLIYTYGHQARTVKLLKVQ